MARNAKRPRRRGHVYRPLQALQSLTQFQELAPGDLVLTGTPAGTALSAPPKPVQSSETCCRRP